MVRLRFHHCDGRVETGTEADCKHCLARLRATSDRDIEIEALKSTLALAVRTRTEKDAELAKLRAEVEALRDKAARLKGFRVDVADEAHPDTWMPVQNYNVSDVEPSTKHDFATHLFPSKRAAWRFARGWRRPNGVWIVRVRSVYRRAVPR
jgi:hypothetical protein